MRDMFSVQSMLLMSCLAAINSIWIWFREILHRKKIKHKTSQDHRLISVATKFVSIDEIFFRRIDFLRQFWSNRRTKIATRNTTTATNEKAQKNDTPSLVEQVKFWEKSNRRRWGDWRKKRMLFNDSNVFISFSLQTKYGVARNVNFDDCTDICSFQCERNSSVRNRWRNEATEKCICLRHNFLFLRRLFFLFYSAGTHVLCASENVAEGEIAHNWRSD